ncbi:MAG: DUF2726 domain-containing protein [Magnetococcales bacterium]|nr:DUF2726 domain-containing protein [Magnetococcales bacterium]
MLSLFAFPVNITFLIILALIFVALYFVAKFISFLFKKLITRTSNRDNERIFISGPLYESTDSLFNKAEIEPYKALKEAVIDKYHIIGKVRVADLIKPEGKRGDEGWQTAFNRITQKHVDFVLCDPDDLNVKAVVELNDKSHLRQDRKKIDLFLEEAFQEANIPFLQFRAQREYLI